LSRDYDVVVLTRKASSQAGGVQFAHWDGKTFGDWSGLLSGAAGVINLTGRSINTRFTPEHRREILDSRIDSVRVLGEAIADAARPPKVFIQASGVGFYGDTGDRICDENCPPGKDFPAEVCRQWEGAFDRVEAPGMRKVVLRLGVVLGRDGGFLKVLGKLTRFFAGGHVGNGRQLVSWIHISDLSHIFLAAFERSDLAGTFNATAPNPVTNAKLMRELRRALHRPWSPPVPEFAARIGSWLMGSEASLALTSQGSVPKRLLDKTFQFEFPELRSALTNLVQKS
jgi:uncharacterized protein (TIGR01777 family)